MEYDVFLYNVMRELDERCAKKLANDEDFKENGIDDVTLEFFLSNAMQSVVKKALDDHVSIEGACKGLLEDENLLDYLVENAIRCANKMFQENE